MNGKSEYDVIVIGGGLGGLTCANVLAKLGYAVLLLEQHHRLGGLATWFKRKGGHVFDISLHGFPVGMIKTCRKYWNQKLAEMIVQVKGLHFDNPQFSLSTTFDVHNFTQVMIEQFKISRETIGEFVATVRAMNFYDNPVVTNGELFERFFPGRDDVTRLLMEPMAYANGSTLDDPALSYGIVFSNFLRKGVYIFRGGTDKVIGEMEAELRRNGVDICTDTQAEKIVIENKRAAGVVVDGRTIKGKAIVSNGNLKSTIHKLAGEENFSQSFLEEVRKVRLTNSSCQVYIGIKKGERIDYIGELLFTSVAEKFDSQALCSKNITSRTFSIYYPGFRADPEMCSIVASSNANYRDWASLSEEEYQTSKKELIETTLNTLERYIPDVRKKIDWVEAATPRTFARYTLHVDGASFGTKFEGVKVSIGLPTELPGLFHTGSVGIIMSGWLGVCNYGVIVANNVDKYLSP